MTQWTKSYTFLKHTESPRVLRKSRVAAWFLLMYLFPTVMNSTVKKRKENIHWSLRLSKILKSKVIWASLHWAKNKNQTEVVGNTTANYLTNFLIYRQTRSVVCVSKTVVLFCPKSISIFSSSFIYFSEWS